MLKALGFGGVACPRCGHRNDEDALWCGHCGMIAGAPRHEPVMQDNRWLPGPDEFAVFFGVRQLDGLFVKTLRVPAATRAYILQGDIATEVPQGEYEIEGFFTRLNNLLRDRHAEILITRTAALPVRFDFTGLQTAEGLEVAASVAVSVKIDSVPAFAQHFMTVPGVVRSVHLAELLGPSVRQLAAEFVAAHALRELAANNHLREQLEERIQSALRLQLGQFGLAVLRVEALEVRHDKLDAKRERAGSLWLVAEHKAAEVDHQKALDQLYNEEEWQRIWRAEQEGRVRYREAEVKADQDVEQRELALQRAERMQAIRLREIELYGRIAEARNRKEALERGAGDVLARLEHEHAKTSAAREDESIEWGHVRRLAQLRMEVELAAAQQDARQEHKLAHQRFLHQLTQQQVRFRIDQALLIEDEARKRTALQRLRQDEEAVQQRRRDLDAERHRAALQSLALQAAAHKREAERAEEYEEQLALGRKRELLRAEDKRDALGQEDVERVQQQIATLRRAGAQADAVAQHEKLLRTIDADARHRAALQDVALAAEEQRLELRMREREAEWQHELARMAGLDRVGDMAKLAVAPAANAGLMAEVMKAQVQASMSANQLSALAATDAVRAAEERLQLERAHQLALLQAQADALRAAPAACRNGHLVAPQDTFCAQCGAALRSG
ncbi:MAG: SPFH domain-containing protein [Telluria sp.]